MRRATRVLVSITSITALFVIAACAAPAPPPPPPAPAGPTPAELVAAADALDKRFMSAFNSGDAAALSATYWNSPNAVSISPDGMGTRGIDNIRTGMAEMFKAMPGAQLEILTSHNEAHGDVVLGWGTFRFTIPAKPKPQILEGRFSDAKAMRDGKMVYLMDHASVPLPPPPPAKK
jgi:ketosteroid isomerase-like protein